MPPGRADAVIAEVGRLVGGIPTLHDAVKALRPILLAVELEPLFLDHTAAQGRGGLLILTGEIVFADRMADLVQGVERLARGM